MVAAFIERDILVELPHLPVDTCADITIFVKLFELFLELALSPTHYRGEDHHTLTFRQAEDAGNDLLNGLASDGLTALVAMRLSNGRKQQTEVIVDLCYGADGRTRAARNRFLFDRDRGAQTFDRVDVGFFKLVEKLAGVSGQ